MGTIILWVVIGILFVTNPGLFFLGGVIFIVYKLLTSSSKPNKFAANQADSPGSDPNNKNRKQENTHEEPHRRFVFKNEDDPEVVELRNSIQDHIKKNRAQADEDLLSEAERAYAARKRAEELGKQPDSKVQ